MRKSSAAFSVIAAAPIAATPPPSKRARARKVATIAAAFTIDLASMTAEAAKKALFAAFPRQIEGSSMPATEATEAAALRYLNARDASTIAEAEKEAAGNVLRYAMGTIETIVGDGWEVTWKEQRSEIDWSAVVKALNIPSEAIEPHRKPNKRVLNVREKAAK